MADWYLYWPVALDIILIGAALALCMIGLGWAAGELSKRFFE